MPNTKPLPTEIARDDFTTGTVLGGRTNDHLIHHRDPDVGGHAGTDLSSFGGDDILEGSVQNGGQIHMFAAKGDDWLTLDVTKNADAIGVQGHHAYGGHGQDTFQITNIDQNESPILGRLDDFDPASDRLFIEGTEINLTGLPQNVELPSGKIIEVRVIEIDHPQFIDEGLGSQHFLAIGDDIFYALEGARDLANGTSGRAGEERHFLDEDALPTLREAETEQYENPENFVPRGFYEDREDELNLNYNQHGIAVEADTGDQSAAHMFGGKSTHHADNGASGGQSMRGSNGDDVIDGNGGNDNISGGAGDDLIAGGIDNDEVQGGTGADMIWGGDGDDDAHGGKGDDYLDGGRGDDTLAGGEGNDTLFGGEGNDTLVGGGGEDDINRFHFYEDGGDDVILDFKVGVDQITLQDDIDPASVELYENEDGNTVLNYGEAGSVELYGVGLESFQEAAEARVEDGEPVISITTDPEEEMLQELRLENGYYDDAGPPDLKVSGVEYGALPFQEAGPSGYSFVSDEELQQSSKAWDGSANRESEREEDDEQGQSPLPEIPIFDDGQDDTDEEDATQLPDEQEEASDGTCFVATAAYQDPWHPDVVFLRAFRDQWLVNRGWGRAFVAFYWQVGPHMAKVVRRNPRLARFSKSGIAGIVRVLRKVWPILKHSFPTPGA